MIEGVLVDLRALEPADILRTLPWRGTAEMARLMGDRYPPSRTSFEALETEFLHVPPAYGEQRLAIDTKDGRHIGNVRLYDLPPEDRSAKLSIRIGEQSERSKGYGTDAVRTLLRFAFEEMNLNRVALEVFEYNQRAIAAYRKCGFVEEARMRLAQFSGGAFHDVLIMAVLRENFERRAAQPDMLEAVR